MRAELVLRDLLFRESRDDDGHPGKKFFEKLFGDAEIADIN
jgi:hypothetical protein